MSAPKAARRSPCWIQDAAAGRGLSPDGQYFALSQGSQICVLRRDGSEDRVPFTFDFVSTYSEWTYSPKSSGGTISARFYTVIPASAALENPGQPSRYYYIPLTGSAAQLAEFVAVPVWESFARIAPNGASVAYVRQEGASQSVHVMDMSTADRTLQTDGRLRILNWNPDSRHVVVYNPDAAADVFAQAVGRAAAPYNDSF